jgi:hypothetical protein
MGTRRWSVSALVAICALAAGLLVFIALLTFPRAFVSAFLVTRGAVRQSILSASPSDAFWTPNTLPETRMLAKVAGDNAERERLLLRSHLLALREALQRTESAPAVTVLFGPPDSPFWPHTDVASQDNATGWCPVACRWTLDVERGLEESRQAPDSAVAFLTMADRSSIGSHTSPALLPSWVPRLSASMENEVQHRSPAVLTRIRQGIPRTDATLSYSLDSAVPLPYLYMHSLFSSAVGSIAGRSLLRQELRRVLRHTLRLEGEEEPGAPSVSLEALLKLPDASPPFWARRSAVAAMISNCLNDGAAPDRLAFFSQLQATSYPAHQYGDCARDRVEERWIPLSSSQLQALARSESDGTQVLQSLPPPPLQTIDPTILRSLKVAPVVSTVRGGDCSFAPVVPLCEASCPSECRWGPQSMEPPPLIRTWLRATASQHSACHPRRNPDRRLPSWVTPGSTPDSTGSCCLSVGLACETALRIVTEVGLLDMSQEPHDKLQGIPPAEYVAQAIDRARRGALSVPSFRSLPSPMQALGSLFRGEKGMWKKSDIFRGYKYVFCPENTVATDYTTEKPLDALLAGAVPLYLGAPSSPSVFLPAGAVFDLRRVRSASHLADVLATIDRAPRTVQQTAAHGWRQRPLSRELDEPFAMLVLFGLLGGLPPGVEVEQSEVDSRDWIGQRGVSTACRVCLCVAGRLHQCDGVARAARATRTAEAEQAISVVGRSETATLAGLGGVSFDDSGRDIAPRPDQSHPVWWLQ